MSVPTALDARNITLLLQSQAENWLKVNAGQLQIDRGERLFSVVVLLNPLKLEEAEKYVHIYLRNWYQHFLKQNMSISFHLKVRNVLETEYK